MADYNAILDTQVQPDAPLTAQLAGQWRDNPIAIAEGASGAPGIRLRALEYPLPGDVVRSRQDTEVSGTSTVTRTMFTFLQRGNVRLYTLARTSSGGGTLKFTLFNNGAYSDLATWATIGPSASAHSVDVYVIPGVTVYATCTTSFVGQTAYLGNTRVMTNGVNLYPNGPYNYVENDYA